MKQRFILILFAVCLIITSPACSSIENNATLGSQLSEQELNSLFELNLPGPSLPPDVIPGTVFCTDYTDQGLLRVCYKNNTDKRLKLQVLNGTSTVYYNLKGDGSIEDFPLQFGDGQYTVQIWQNTEGDEYFSAESDTFAVTISDEAVVYLNSVQNIDWDYDLPAVRDVRRILAGSLKSSAINDLKYSCVKSIYRYIIENIKYDSEKIFDLKYDYIPDIDQVYRDKKGICYDYASLFAAMLRSINIPAKLVKGYAGYSPDTYHAWNEVYLNGKWITIDTTRDASLFASGAPFSMEKNAADYVKIYEY